MATLAGTLATTIQRRVRDISGLAHTTADVLTVMTHCERLLLCRTAAVQTTETVTNTEGLRTFTPTLMRVVGMQTQDGREIPFTTRDTMDRLRPDWIGGDTRADEPTTWWRLGVDLVGYYPARRGIGQTIAVRGVALTTALSSGDTLTLPDNLTGALVSMVEEVLLARQRLFASTKVAGGHRMLAQDETTR